MQTVIYANLGISSVSKQLAYNLVNQIVSAFCAISAATLTDRMPRRAILPAGTLMCAVLLAINAGLSTVLDRQTKADNVSSSVASGALAAY